MSLKPASVFYSIHTSWLSWVIFLQPPVHLHSLYNPLGNTSSELLAPRCICMFGGFSLLLSEVHHPILLLQVRCRDSNLGFSIFKGGAYNQKIYIYEAPCLEFQWSTFASASSRSFHSCPLAAPSTCLSLIVCWKLLLKSCLKCHFESTLERWSRREARGVGRSKGSL